MSTVPAHPGHAITVTPGPFGRAFFECSCGEAQVRASKSQAVRVALAHHHEVNGCNCGDDVRALPEHTPTSSAEPDLAGRYWLTPEGYDALARAEREQASDEAGTAPGGGDGVMRAGAIVTIPDHISGGRGSQTRQPGLPGRWCVWSKVTGGPGWHALTPADEAARATGAKWVTVRIAFAKDAATPTVQLMACEPRTVMPEPVKHQENAR